VNAPACISNALRSYQRRIESAANGPRRTLLARHMFFGGWAEAYLLPGLHPDNLKKLTESGIGRPRGSFWYLEGWYGSVRWKSPFEGLKSGMFVEFYNIGMRILIRGDLIQRNLPSIRRPIYQRYQWRHRNRCSSSQSKSEPRRQQQQTKRPPASQLRHHKRRARNRSDDLTKRNRNRMRRCRHLRGRLVWHQPYPVLGPASK
jgi:hypothetical protein